MSLAVEYELPSGSIALCNFSAENLHAAQIYVEENTSSIPIMQTHQE
jgi:hypothetical protein